MDVGRQKLRKNCNFLSVARNPFARNGRWTSKTEEKLRLYLVNRNPYTRNGRWTSKTEEKLQLLSVARNPFARNGRWTSKTEEKLRFDFFSGKHATSAVVKAANMPHLQHHGTDLCLEAACGSWKACVPSGTWN